MLKKTTARAEGNRQRACENTPTNGANHNTTLCICGEVFQSADVYVITSHPITTVTRCCVECHRTFATGSFAEKIALANLLLRRAEEKEVKR